MKLSWWPWKARRQLRRAVEDLQGQVRRLEQLHLLNAGIGVEEIEDVGVA